MRRFALMAARTLEYPYMNSEAAVVKGSDSGARVNSLGAADPVEVWAGLSEPSLEVYLADCSPSLLAPFESGRCVKRGFPGRSSVLYRSRGS